MLQRTSLRALRAASHRPTPTIPTNTLRAASSRSTDNPVPANDPNPTPAHSPVHPNTTNALATSSEGAGDFVVQESPEKAEERRVMQAPNREGIWSRSQKPRAEAMVGPRFEQTVMEDQAHEKNRKYLQSLPSTSFPLEPTNDPAALPSGHITGKTGSTEPYQSNTGLPLEQR
ncbi:hypothetical protein LTS09_001433 [Friedmanniomyces endolithicus]|nr:hypothetical protein LTS09_001433 [Friedmanniomyces endolithicus]